MQQKLKINKYEFDVKNAEMNFLRVDYDNKLQIGAYINVEFYPNYIDNYPLYGSVSLEIPNIKIKKIDELVGKQFKVTTNDDELEELELIQLRTNHFNTNNRLWNDDQIFGNAELKFKERDNNKFLVKFNIKEDNGIEIYYEGWITFQGVFVDEKNNHEENQQFLSEYLNVDDYYEFPLIKVTNNYKSVLYIPKNKR